MVVTAAEKLSGRLLVSGNILTLQNVTSEDVTVVRCDASNLYGDVSASAYLNVYSKQLFSFKVPCFTRNFHMVPCATQH
jgi:hypothetical protein